jgi:hypothetical protein
MRHNGLVLPKRRIVSAAKTPRKAKKKMSENHR